MDERSVKTDWLWQKVKANQKQFLTIQLTTTHDSELFPLDQKNKKKSTCWISVQTQINLSPSSKLCAHGSYSFLLCTVIWRSTGMDCKAAVSKTSKVKDVIQ